MRGKFIERGIQTGGGGAKHAQTQCIPAVTKKDFGAQSDGVKFMDKQGQTDFGTFAELQARIIRMEVVLRKKKKKKKNKDGEKKPGIPDVNGVI